MRQPNSGSPEFGNIIGQIGIHTPDHGFEFRACSFHSRPGMTAFIGDGTPRRAT